MNDMLKKIVKYTLRVLLAVTVVLILVSLSLYIPAVQDFARKKAVSIVSEKTGMQLSVGRIRLGFPLSLSVDSTLLVTPQGDTLLQCGSLGADVALWPLLRKQALIRRFTLDRAKVHFGDSASGLELRATVGRLRLKAAATHLKNNLADISSIELSDGTVSLSLGESPADTATRKDTLPAVPWTILAGQVALNNIGFSMSTSPDRTQLDARLASARIRRAAVDLGEQQVTAGNVSLRSGSFSYLSDTTSKESAPATEDSIAAKSPPWTVRVDHILLADMDGTYGTWQSMPGDGFDPGHIGVSKLLLSADSLVNRGNSIRVRVNRLSFAERSGLTIESLHGMFEMDSARIALSGFEMKTPSSEVRADIRAGASLLQMSPDAPLEMLLTADVGMADLIPFMPREGRKISGVIGQRKIGLRSDISGSLDRLYIGSVELMMPSHIRFSASGNVESALHPARIGGRLRFDGRFDRLGFLTALLPDTALRKRIGIPDRLTLKGTLAATRGALSPDITLAADSGRLRLTGMLDRNSRRYRAEIASDSLPLGSFLPADSLGLLTLDLTAEGQGFDPFDAKTSAQAKLRIDRLDYGGFDYGGIGLDALLADHRLTGRLDAVNRELAAGFDLNGMLTRGRQQIRIRGGIDSCDLHDMGLMKERLSVRLRLDAEATVDSTKTYSLKLALDSILLRDRWKLNTIRPTTLTLLSAPQRVEAALRSGDMRLDFESPVGADSLIAGITHSATLIGEQMRQGNLDMEEIRPLVPPYRLAITAGRDNIINNFLKTKGIQFYALSVGSASGSGKPLSTRITVERLAAGNFRIDTVAVGAWQQDNRLRYGLRLSNAPGNLDSVAQIALYGDIESNRATLNCRQRTRSGKQGFNFGLQASLADSTVTVSMYPENPILGFETWQVNPGNYIAYRLNREIDAAFSLTRPGQRISLQSLDTATQGRGIDLDIAGIGIGGVLGLFPGAPPVDGTLDMDFKVKLSAAATDIGGTLSIAELAYDKQRIGNLGLELHYTPDSLGQHADLKMAVDGEQALTAEGLYHGSAEHPVHLDVRMPGLPLALANAFLPADVVRLSGLLKGSVGIKGTSVRLRADGELAFADTRVQVPMAGASFGLSPDKIVISDNVVQFTDFGIIAQNKNPMQVNGTVDLADFADMTADLKIAASDFQLLNTPRNRTSLVYGKASMDIDVSARGPLDELTIRGNAELLGNTDITYVMRDSPLDIKNKPQTLVTFVSFSDTTQVEAADTTQTIRIGGMDLLVNINVNNSAKLAVDLSVDGQNRIDLQGGGNLTYTMNRLGDSRFSGKYVVSGGQVRYNPPVISEKIFKINPGSYVDWIGNIADPSMNITAVETVRATVATENGDNRPVKFNITIVIRNSLENLSISFDLSAPEDLTIQNQLQSMTAEERATQAMSLLIYNTYSGPGTTAKINSSNALNSFIQKELNQWAQNNLRGVDLSFGIDSYDDATDGKGTRTDYSYQLSKSLFNDRLKAVIGGKFSSDADPDQNLKENLVDDISLEYRLTKRDNMFLKLFHHKGYESILEGEVTETGVGFIIRKKMLRLGDLFRIIRNRVDRLPKTENTKPAHE